MASFIVVLFAVVITFSFTFRTTEGDGCLTTQSDPGALYLKQLRQAIDTEECQLVKDVSYTDTDVDEKDLFDFIIIGAGSAGAVAANRLSEDPDRKVLLLEAGGDPTITSEIPALFALTLNTKLDWQYRTEPEPTNCLGSVEGRCTWPRGKVLGGTSAINAMLYVRGNPKDYDAWETTGNPGWNYENMLHYFKKSEDFRSEAVSKDEDFLTYHGIGGLLKVDSFKYDTKLFTDHFSGGFKELGLQSFNDTNAQHHEGFFILQGTLENGKRCSTAKGFLHDFQSRPNLKISKNSFVRKVLIDDEKNAYGVEFSKGGEIFKINATKEVILSAGTVNSPQLLMLSGIGPETHLEKLGIKVIQNSKVGYNLQDHTLMRGYVVTMDIQVPPFDNLERTFQFLAKGEGYLSGVNLFSNAAFIKTQQDTHPDVQIYLTSFAANSTNALRQALTTIGFDEAIQRSMLDINSKQYTLIIMPAVLRPKSRGRILLRSRNPLDYPLIYPGYLKEERDMKTNLDAVHFANEFINTKPMRELGAKLERIDIPACRPSEFQSESYWRCVIRHMSVSVYHPVGTCKMGPREHDDSVVDAHLRVIGIKHLRVVDASMMPTIVSGGTNAPAIAIAEKAADLIKQHWKSQ